MIDTRYPASRSAVASCHTRRSNGLGRFSTRINTRLGPLMSAVFRALPTDPFVDAGHAARIGDAHKVDDGLPVGQALGNVAEFRRGVADDDGPGVLENLVDARDHQPRDMRNAVE